MFLYQFSSGSSNSARLYCMVDKFYYRGYLWQIYDKTKSFLHRRDSKDEMAGQNLRDLVNGLFLKSAAKYIMYVIDGNEGLFINFFNNGF